MGRITTIPNIKQAFEGTRLRIPIAQLQPLKLITPATKKTLKYLQMPRRFARWVSWSHLL